MRILVLSVFIIPFCNVNAQLWSPGGSFDGKELTNYVPPTENDTVYFICAGETGTLTAMPQGGIPDWDFVWSVYESTFNAWQTYESDLGVATSTKTGLEPGGYRLIIYDGNGDNVGAYRAWISEITVPASVDVTDIEPGCTFLDLVGNINWGTATPVYNPPADGLIITPSTEITVCFTGVHSYVSDMGFYLVGPCGVEAEVVLFPPEPTACNNGNNFNNLCFTTNPAANFIMCPAPTPLTGTFSSYGSGNTPIDWSPIYGCDATSEGWSYLVVDCAFGDFGIVNDVTITFEGEDDFGNLSTVVISTPDPWNQPLEDGFCNFIENPVPIGDAEPIIAPFNQTFIWTDNNGTFTIPAPDNTTSLNIQNLAVPLTNTDFTLTIGGSVMYPLCGGDINDTEPFLFEAEVEPNITSNPGTLCENNGQVDLDADVSGGTWSGPGIIDTVNGIFNPAGLGNSSPSIVYTISSPCTAVDQITIEVEDFTQAAITEVGTVCLNATPFQLFAAPSGGTWGGDAGSNGMFNPATAGIGTATVTYTISGVCASTDSEDITVQASDTVVITNPIVNQEFCLNGAPYQCEASIAGGTWTITGGGTITANGLFSPSVAVTPTISYETAGACPGIATVAVVVNPLPTVNASADAEICQGESATLTANGAGAGGSYSWSPATNPPNGASVSTSTGGTYTVTGTDANLCQDTDQVTVIVNPNPVVNIPAVGTLCAGDDVTLVATPGFTTYSWTNAGTLSENDINNPVADPVVTTTYQVTVTDANGCIGTDDITVTVVTGDPTFTVSESEGLIPLVVTFTPNGNASQYVWDFGNDDGDVTEPGDNDPTTIYDVMDYYNATLTITVMGCVFSSSQEIFAYENSRVVLVPNVITPNGDGDNETFDVDVRNMETLDIRIYNRWGNEVGQVTKPDDVWLPGDLSEGTYFYHFRAVGFDGIVYELEGSLTILR